ncbi:heparinase II/III domain-containing protein [Hymenobacter chitinivorans]|uniref:Putative secreted protein (Por secretion system target) n=1 Tax=Hymenobacter chitinivorans DSM 11115 TaxID=1121954 RepID=A0A2M9BP65_9BACT|nr:heparinase II/III family protein [Hymenobacter chitinivorans]PJJ59741.1 putative secreted protein (Por secretion system target) [Hymenobacter chitinivorans DSM 11115]
MLPAWGQTGSWNPPGADTSYPRTLLRAAALPEVQASLLRQPALGLYQGLYQSASAQPTPDNASADGRRSRATLAKNAAFVALLDRKAENNTLSPLPAAEKAALLANARGLLETINTDVEVYASLSNLSSYNEWQWRSKELIDYLIAYDLLRGAGETTSSLAAARLRLQAFAGNLDSQAVKPFRPVSFMSYEFFKQVKNNHALMTAAALGMAAVVLNDVGSATAVSRRPTSWINDGLYNLDNILWQDPQRQSDPAKVAGYAEGPYYFKYAFLNCLPFFRALGHFLPDNTLTYTFGGSSRIIRNPYYDPRYDQLYDWITAILLPDGRLPALEDSYVDLGMPELALTGKSRYVRPLHLGNLSGRQLNSLTAQLRDATVDMRAAYLAANLTPTEPTNAPLTALPASGNLVFRSGNDSLATYLHVNGKSGAAQANSGGHSQADASSFLLFAHGQLLALDPGYLSYGRRDSLGQATNHNMLLVDNAGPAIGAPGAANDAAASIRTTFQTEKLSYGEVQTAYKAATITRKTLFVRNSYYLLADFVQAGAAHSYTWQLHGYGLENGPPATGTFTDNLAGHEGIWQKNGVSLLAHVTATGGASSYAKATNRHELSYNLSEKHTTLLVQKSGAAATQFLAALVPFTATAPRLTTSSTATTAALTSTAADFQDLAFAQTDTVLTTSVSTLLPQPVQADGLVNFLSLDAAGGFAQLFLEQGTTLSYGAAPFISSAKRATISWQRTGATAYAGYVSRATTLAIPLGTAPTAVTGPGVSSFSFDAASQQLRIVLSQASGFRVTLPAAGGNVLPVELIGFTARRVGRGVQLAWQTASEHQNRGFAVERRTTSESQFREIGLVNGRGTATTAQPYSYQDAAAPTEAVYYRLRQLDEDGHPTYSPVVALAAAAVAPGLSVAPVPTQDFLAVTLTGTAAQSVELTLLDQQGRVVLRQAAQGETRLTVSNLLPGLYFLRATDAAGNLVGKPQKVLIAR